MNNLFFLSNSPGEVSGWVKPVAEAFAEINRGVRVTLAVLPCPYASGMEKRYGSEISGIDRSLTFREVWRLGRGSGESLILQLGGDPMYGAMLSLKLSAPWMIYTARPRWKSRVSHYFIPDAGAEQRFAKANVNRDRFSRVGNLALDSIPRDLTVLEAKAALGLEQDTELIAFLPGSRPFEYMQGAAFFSHAADRVLRAFPGMIALMPIAQTVDESLLAAGLRKCGLSWEGERRVETIICGGSRIRLVRGDTFSVIKAATLVVALPGTNNLQTAALGTPLLMVAPLNEAENIPLDGIPGIIPPGFPGFRQLKRKLVFKINNREKFISLPNRIAQKAIVPEYRGLLTPEMTADMAEKLLASPERLAGINKGYAEIAFEYGAAMKIARHLGSFFGH